MPIAFGGHARTYRLHVPEAVATHPDRAVPLVVALHGGGGNGAQLANTSQLDVEADRLGFVVAYPDGLLLARPTGVSIRTWNGGGCCAPAMSSGVDDVGFVAAIIEEIGAATAIDPGRVVVGGHSNGGILSWRIACERADVLAAAVIVEGSLERPTCTPSRGVDLVQVHGDADEFLPLEGGVGPKSFSGTGFTSAAASQALWTSAQGCGPGVASTSDHLAITTWPDCADDTESELVVIEGGTHAWAGADPARSADFLGEPSPFFSATGVFTDFAASPRPDARLRRRGGDTMVGDDVHNSSGARQTRRGTATAGHRVTYQVSLQNDALVADRLHVQGGRSAPGFSVQYVDQAGTDVTHRVTAGTYVTPELGPYRTHPLRIVVTVLRAAPPGTSVDRTLTVRSAADPDRHDTVRFVTSRR